MNYIKELYTNISEKLTSLKNIKIPGFDNLKEQFASLANKIPSFSQLTSKFNFKFSLNSLTSKLPSIQSIMNKLTGAFKGFKFKVPSLFKKSENIKPTQPTAKSVNQSQNSHKKVSRKRPKRSN